MCIPTRAGTGWAWRTGGWRGDGTVRRKAIFFDNDGILVDTEHLYFRATREVLHTVDMDLTKDQFIDLFLVRGTGCWHLVEEKGIGAEQIEALKERRNVLYADLLRGESRALPGVEDVLDSLRGDYAMGVVTSSRPDHFRIIHETTGLLKYFEFVVASGDYRRSKPQPDPYLLALEKVGLPADACVAVEDSERGLLSATRAGLRCLIVPTGLNAGRTFEGAHRVLGSIAELPAALNGGDTA